MQGLEQTQAAFAEALQNPECPVPESITSRTKGMTLGRFNVHRNNMYAGLIGVLKARYPAVRRLVGDEFFRAMARVFIDERPPYSPVLLEYGASFSKFLKSFEPVSDVPYLPDVAWLEWRLHIARHAADCAAVPLGAISAHGDRAAALRFRFAPAVSLVSSSYPVFSLWRANAPEGAQPGPIALAGDEFVLVSRPALIPEAVRIPPACAAFIAALMSNRTLGDASEVALHEDPAFPLGRAFGLLVTQKAISEVHTPELAEEGCTP